MAEAFAALGIAASIFQFLELGFKATRTIIATYRDIDIDGLAQRNAEIALTCSDFEEHCLRLKKDKAAVKDDDLAQLLTRCINAATKLSTEVDRLRVPDSQRHRRLTKVKISIISYWKRNTIEGLQADLVDVRAQICFRLQGLFYEHHRSLAISVNTWGKASKAWNRATEQKLDVMAQQVKDLLKWESKTESGGVNELAQALTAFAEEAKSHGITRAILESLHFTQIKERQNEIPKAHKDTFTWIFHENGPGNFTNWLKGPSGIFWVTGKPGSGKSTLMKFILGHETTKRLAMAWANPKPLFIASHFFWFGGTKLQKSLEGLLRTLLFQILSNAPDVISKVLPDRVSGQFQYLESWTLEDLYEAFDHLQTLKTFPYRILILVDGLDEYSGQVTDVTTFLHTITKSPEIKVCCASRPWQEFHNAFSNAYGQIEMQSLTAEDMRLYVQNTLEQNERFKTLQSSHQAQGELLIDSVSTKAEGVFFWVSLVVKSLLRGLDNNDGLELLQRRVSEFPRGLEPFLKRMVESIEDVYKPEVVRVFSMLLMANAPLPLILFRARNSNLVLEMETKSSSTGSSRCETLRETANAINNQQSLHHGELQTGDPGIIDEINLSNDFDGGTRSLLRYKERLLSHCRDLVQAWQVTNSDLPYHHTNIRLGFLHRTVFEFFQQRENWPAIDDRIYLDRYFLARSCLCVLSATTIHKNVNTDFIRWFLYILQETSSWTDDLAYNDGYMLFRRCEELIQVLNTGTESHLGRKDVNVDGLFRLLAISQARILIQKYQYEQSDQHVNYIQYYEDRRSDSILRHILRGSGYIEVGDHPREVMSDFVDLELLNNVLRIDGFKKHIVQPPNSGRCPRLLSVWETFFTRLSSPAHELGPRNGYEACEIMAKNGAARVAFIPGQRDVDVMQHLRETNTFPEDKIRALESLFPSDTSADQRQPKKKGKRPARRKGKKKT